MSDSLNRVPSHDNAPTTTAQEGSLNNDNGKICTNCGRMIDPTDPIIYNDMGQFCSITCMNQMTMDSYAP